MQLQKGTYYALRGLRSVLRRPPGAVVQIASVAEEEGLPPDSLAKLFRRLTRAGILQTHRGVNGGVSLARAPGQISLRSVIEALEGSLSLNGCPVASPACDAGRKCSVFQAVCRTQRAWLAALEREPITGLCRPGGVAGRS
jgi:Rrf2 family protein